VSPLDLFKCRVGSRSGRGSDIRARTQHAPSVRSSHSFLFDVTGRGFSGWVGFFFMSRVFSGWVRFWVKNHSTCPARELLRVENYDPYPTVALVRSD
jgi:hypothetical protein